jgi:hypothetical protein
MEAVAAIQPELYVSVADEVTAEAKGKRLQASVDRTSKVGAHMSYDMHASPQANDPGPLPM